MASDLEKEMQSQSEISVYIRELLPRDGPNLQPLQFFGRRGRVT